MSFYVYLSSHLSKSHHNNTNTILNFTTELSSPLELESDYEVALVEISYPKLHHLNSLYFFIYTDIVDYTYVGSKQYPILRPILFKNTDNYSVLNTDHFVNLLYLPVNKKIIKSIEIQIEPDLISVPIYSLSIGDIFLTLHFKKRE